MNRGRRRCKFCCFHLDITLDNHSPEIGDSVNQRSLTGNVSMGAASTSNVVGIDVVAAGNSSYLTETDSCVID